MVLRKGTLFGEQTKQIVVFAQTRLFNVNVFYVPGFKQMDNLLIQHCVFADKDMTRLGQYGSSQYHSRLKLGNPDGFSRP